jgi:hypothetical protein
MRVPRFLASSLAIAGLMLAAFLIYGRYLGRDHFTASGDSTPAVSYALNYRLAVEDGQWLPRLVVIPRDVSLGLGSIDGTVPTADAPDFQYYAFLQSAIAWPLLRVGLPGLKAIQWVVVLAFAMAALVMYTAGRVVGARRSVAFLAATSYIVSPWLVSNFYGRGGISEALAQANLPWLLLGFAYLARDCKGRATIAVATGIAALALSHNIFLLYGALLCAFFAASLFLFPGTAGDHAQMALLLRLRAPVVISIGVALGLAITAWQWLPASLSLDEISFHYLGTFGEAGQIPKAYADWSGAWGIPSRFVEPWSGTPREFFFTIGWWTIPSMLLLALTPRPLRAYGVAIGLSFLLFAALIQFPAQIYPLLPGPFGATQFNFRLLAYISVLGAFALCIARPNLNGWATWPALAIVLASQIGVITFPMPPAGGITPLHEEQYLKGSEYNAFYANSPAERSLRYYPDGYMMPNHHLDLRYRTWLRAGNWWAEDMQPPGRPPQPVHVRIVGRLATGLTSTSLHLARPDAPDRPVSNREVITGPTFDITLSAPLAGDDLRIIAEPTITVGKRTLSIRPEQVFVAWGDARSLVAAAELDLRGKHGYWRRFALPPAVRSAHVPDPTGVFTVELPMIYNRFWLARQAGQTLDTAVDFNHRLIVRTTNLTDDIEIVYRLPASVWWLTGLGLAGFLATAVAALRSHSRPPQNPRVHPAA